MVTRQPGAKPVLPTSWCNCLKSPGSFLRFCLLPSHCVELQALGCFGGWSLWSCPALHPEGGGRVTSPTLGMWGSPERLSRSPRDLLLHLHLGLGVPHVPGIQDLSDEGTSPVERRTPLWIWARTGEALSPVQPLCDIFSDGGECRAIASPEVFGILSSLVWGRQVTTLAALLQPNAGKRDAMDQGRAVSTERHNLLLNNKHTQTLLCPSPLPLDTPKGPLGLMTCWYHTRQVMQGLLACGGLTVPGAEETGHGVFGGRQACVGTAALPLCRLGLVIPLRASVFSSH